MNTSPLELVYAFFCETVRLEASGQISPIGIWGDTVKFAVNAPALMPCLAFHAFVRNLGLNPLKFRLKVTFPGKAKPVEVEMPLQGNEVQTCQNVNFNNAGLQITEPGDVVAHVRIDSTPPIDREFRLQMVFPPQSAITTLVH